MPDTLKFDVCGFVDIAFYVHGTAVISIFSVKGTDAEVNLKPVVEFQKGKEI